ncbi:CaiB/BaiF CoA transferase family protein [Afifella pfennigii]|uniref:CaiB/BaiF CoA transferase family protein n=1 Tax=Afifella pfennigii TaxID=209897 RepID=UPI00047EC46E|nr:CaiB/BaiF CoA-transferase family protein [Afifella pfennigii]
MRPLEGLKVVAIEQAVAAPFATSRLADAGARVIKVERPEGDFARGYDDVARGQSSYFVWLNRGKESVTLDLASEAGRAAMARLVEEADVLVQNLKPGALARLGFEPAALRRANPRLVTCSISGYGEAGPMAQRKAYDLLIQAESGLCSITGGPSEPARVGISIVDIATGATAYSAILEALIRRGITGEGAQIELSMFDVMADWLTVPLLNHEGGRPPKRAGLSHPSIAPYGAFRPRTGAPILISIQSEREWSRFCDVFLGDPALASDPRFATNLARVTHREATDALVAEAFARHDAATAIELLQKAGIALASVNDMAGLSAHPHLRRITVDTPNGPVSFPAPGARFVGEERAYGPVPALAARSRG